MSRLEHTQREEREPHRDGGKVGEIAEVDHAFGERLEMVGGNFSIESSGAGAILLAEIPFQQNGVLARSKSS